LQWNKIAVEQNCSQTKLQSNKIAVEQNCSRTKLQSNKIAVEQNCSQTKLQSNKIAVEQNCSRTKLQSNKIAVEQNCSGPAENEKLSFRCINFINLPLDVFLSSYLDRPSQPWRKNSIHEKPLKLSRKKISRLAIKNK
jgi:hypothetical protein